MLLHIISIKEGKIQTAVIPFKTISSIECEYDKDTDKETAEVCIHFTANNADLTINDRETTSLLFRIFEKEDPEKEKYESTTVKVFEVDFIEAMSKYLTTECAVDGYNITP